MEGHLEEERIDGEGPVESATPLRPRWRKKRWAFPGIALLVLFGIALVAWMNRASFADDLIQEQLSFYDLPATYTIERVGPQTQILGNVVVGDPADPDFTARQAIVRLHHRFGLPEIGSVELVEPRVYGRFADGQVSFGALDRVIYRKSDGPPGLPDLDLIIRDGRGRIDSEFGAIGLKIEGAGNLSDGFTGIAAATAPRMAIEGCRVSQATAFGRISTDGGRPHFAGPVRIQEAACADAAQIADLTAELDLVSNAQFGSPRMVARLESGAARYGDASFGGLAGTVRGNAGEGVWAARYNLVGRSLSTPQALAAVTVIEGSARSLPGTGVEIAAQVEGNGLRLGAQANALLTSAERGTDGTLVAPLIRQFVNSVQAQARGSALDTEIRLRSSAEGYTLIIPRAEITGRGGDRIVSLSRVEAVGSRGSKPTVAGNIAMAGPGLPRLSGRMERTGAGNSIFRLRMQPYAAGTSRLAVPELVVRQGANGALGFAGDILASGPLPGGAVEDLQLPVTGRLSADGTLAMWSECITPRFASLRYANLSLAGQSVTLCPAPGRPLLAYGNNGVRLAAGAPSLALAGMLGETPITLATGAVGFAYPGVLRAEAVDVALGPVERPTRFLISNLDARLGPNLGGTFADAGVTLPSVPLDIVEAAGEWQYVGGELALSSGTFRLLDRQTQDRFRPLAARDARLNLVDNRITAAADLRDPGSDRIVTRAEIRHDLSTGAGFADLTVPGILFDEQLQPEQLSRLALGVVANVRGSVTGEGRIDWSPGAVTSTGAFSSDDLDFAAAFGPVRGASGTIVFTDLLGLTTAPGQTLRVASINPGIEVNDGEVAFALRGGEVLAVEGGSWPFMGGRLILRDTALNIGISEERRYVFEIVGLQAAQFVAQLDLENLAATGVFDGTLPIVFDSAGNGRIEGGLLVSRSPGGNIAYVGELTYEDLSPIANFAFDALRSLDFSQMTVAMDGPLTGEIVTRVRFDGVSQGDGAKRNFITRRLAKLPLQFRVNLRAPFYKLITSLKSLYDPSAVRDPRGLGLLSDDGTRLLRQSISGDEVEDQITPDDLVPGAQLPAIQSEESEEGP